MKCALALSYAERSQANLSFSNSFATIVCAVTKLDVMFLCWPPRAPKMWAEFVDALRLLHPTTIAALNYIYSSSNFMLQYAGASINELPDASRAIDGLAFARWIEQPMCDCSAGYRKALPRDGAVQCRRAPGGTRIDPCHWVDIGIGIEYLDASILIYAMAIRYRCW